MPIQPPRYVTRFRVRKPAQDWRDPGPDLLRPRAKARRQLAILIHDLHGPFWVKRNDQNWVKVGTRSEVLEAFRKWGGREFRVGKGKHAPTVVAVVKRERVPFLALSNCSPKTSLNWSLSHFQFPDAKFAGGYVYKQVSGSSSFSDHAWGTAYDQTENGRDTIERITSWSARMARANCMDFDYALGSLNGSQVVAIDGDSGEVHASGASKSHLWHKHESTVDHDGRRPPRTGGVW